MRWILSREDTLRVPASQSDIQVAERRTPWLLAWLAFLPLVLIRAENFAESDTFWAIRTGVLTMATRSLPTRDPFSWTAAGEPWTLNAWGFNVVLGGAYLAFGLAGTAIVSSIFVALIGGLVLFQARQLGANPVVAGYVLFVGGAMATTWITARPQIVDYSAMLVIVLLLGRLRVAARPVCVLVWLAVVTTMWANLHAAALLGALVCGAATIGILASRSERWQAIRFVTASLTVAMCCFFTPYGVGIVGQTLLVKNESSNIKEWQAFDPGDPLQLLVLAAGVIALLVSIRRRDPVAVAVLSATLCASFAAYRILPILLFLSLPVLAAGAPPKLLQYFRSRRKMLNQGAVAAVVIAASAAMVNVQSLGRPDPTHFPVSAIQQIPTGCHLYNDYQIGGLVILERPDVKVSMDSRNDLYGSARVDKSLETVAGRGDLDSALQGADCALVPPDTGLAAYLEASPLWSIAFSEPAGSLFVRKGE
ncbi:hypothetical protein [Pseudarthrobacter enclensis]|uniref:Glycosyltransferase RgtA/B/C/D-like domain-containing protein n=1 Tax=Pseudarthrobacter enclensis TaxID=993070 RepID=A0ABT9RS06_9MICC|nr:hypothetical protein [Pseudarthrobacter enclensis]MDP9887099.1 hypothetical protein [Pseudarthrobacter enclensis]